MADSNAFDVIIIGAGPAGLSAAHTAAKAGCRTLLLEKLSQAGHLGHPCGGVIAPVPGYIHGHDSPDGLNFPEIDLTIPPSLVRGKPTRQRYISPGGFSFQASFQSRDDFPIVAIDKPALLQLLASQATAAGAILNFGTAVTSLIRENERVVGVSTHHQKFLAKVIISAEGASRQFTEEAGLYDSLIAKPRYAFIVCEVLDAPAAGEDNVGQISTLGKRYTSAQLPVFGTVVIPTPGRAEVYFSVFADQPQVHTDGSLWHYLEEYKQQDPRINGLLTNAQVLRRSGTRLSLREAPACVVGDGLVGVGDSVGPGGHVGILPSIFLGQQAARTAAKAILAGDVSRQALSEYDQVYHGPILNGLEVEYKIITSLASLEDEELDRICQTLSPVNLAPFFLGDKQWMLLETLRWMIVTLPLILRDWRLIRRMITGDTAG